LLALLVVACSSAPEDGPAQAVEQFYGHLNDGDYRRAMALYSAEARAALDDPDSASAEGFADWAKLETKDGKVDRVQVTQEQADEASATVEFSVVYKDGTSASHTVTLTFEDGAWKLGLIS
jgi:hypothetical protein